MNSLLSPRKIRLLVPVLGILGLALRLLMLSTGIDDKGLLRAGHPAWVALLILSAVTAAVIGLCVGRLRGSGIYRVSFPPSNLRALGYLVMAAGTAFCAARSWRLGSGITLLQIPVKLFLCLMPPAILAAAYCRRTSRRPLFLIHVGMCVHFAVHALVTYRTWSFDPQIHDYCFRLFANIALSMTAYQLAAFDIGKGSHRRLWLWGLAAVYLCCVSLDGTPVYTAGAIWAFTALSSLRRRRPHHQPVPEAAEAGTGQQTQ